MSAGIVGGYHEGHIHFWDHNTVVLMLLAIFMIGFAIQTKAGIYLEIQDGRNLLNAGYSDFGDDLLDIHGILYIYRMPQYPLKWYGGSLMVFCLRDEKGNLRCTALRERAYAEKTLRKFLLRIKEIKPTIELDPEYEAFLRGEILLWDASKNTPASVEKRLREKGEKWEELGFWQRLRTKL